jgi:hypothetical protein
MISKIMVDREKVERKIQQLNEFMDILENLSKLKRIT